MQATVVMLIALGGLGCQNPVSDLPPVLPDVRQSAGQPATNAGPVTPAAPDAPTPSVTPSAPASTAPVAYPVYTQGPNGDTDAADDDSFGTCLRNTFCSFFIGRDPGIPTAAEIEAAYHAGLHNR